MIDILLLLFTALLGMVLSYLIVTVFNIGGSPDEALNRDLQAMVMQIVVQAVSVVFLPLKGIWNIGNELSILSVQYAKWLVAGVLLVAAAILMHYYHYEMLSIIDDGWTCAVVPILRNIISPLLQIWRVIFAITTPIINAFLVINAQIFRGWISTFAQCSHINLFQVITEFSKAIITGTHSVTSFFGYGSHPKDDNNFYNNDFDISLPVNHTLTAISVTQKVLACTCKRFEPLFNIGFFVTQEPHVTAAINNGFQVFIRAFQMVFNLLFKKFPDVYKVTFKLERALNEGGLALDAVLFNTFEDFIRILCNCDFTIKKKPLEGPFTIGTRVISAAVHVSATISVNAPLHMVGATFVKDESAFAPENWSMERAFSQLHRAVYSSGVLVQWVLFVLERLVTDTANIDRILEDENTPPLELSCDWARDVKDHRYVSMSYTAGCSVYNLGIIPVNTALIAYSLIVELLTTSIFQQQQNIFRTLQRWEGPTLPRNKVYTCEERRDVTAYDYLHNLNYTRTGGWLWTQDRSKCECSRSYGATISENEAFYNPWCGQPSLNFDVFAPMDALVMHVSHGILGPGFGDAFPFIDPIRNIEIDLQAGDKSIKKTIALPFPLPPLTRTAIESIRVLTRVVLSFGDIVTGNFFSYPVNCGHGMNLIQLKKKWDIEHCIQWKKDKFNVECEAYDTTLHPTPENMRWASCKARAYKALQTENRRTPVCDTDNHSPSCMCSYLQPLTTQSPCMCIARYPDLDITASTQEVGDLIEKRFTSEDVSHHWCNSMIIEWTFQNTAAFADALDYMVSLGPINPTCDVMDRIIENKPLRMGQLDQRSESAYLIANTPTLEFVGEYMDATTKLNHIKDIYTDMRGGCEIEPPKFVPATDENGNVIYELDENGDPKKDENGEPIAKLTTIGSRWSCDASDSLAKSIGEIEMEELLRSKDPEKSPGCRIWGRDDFFCSAGLFVRNSKRLSMNVARQAINDGISILSGNYADINLQTLPRLCDYERQQGAVAAMIAGIIPGISIEMKQAFAKYINMILQQFFIQPLRISLTLAQMATTIVMDFVSESNTQSSIKDTFKNGVDTIIDGQLWAIRYFFETTGELLDAISPGAGDICDSIVKIIDMLKKAIKQDLLRIVSLMLDAFFHLMAALTGDTSAISPFFTSLFSLWTELETLLLTEVMVILNKIFDFFGPVGTFFNVLLWGVCNAINSVMAAINSAIKVVSLGFSSIGWKDMTCVEPGSSGRRLGATYSNHTSGSLGKHFLRAHDNKHLTKRVAEHLDWNGTSVCDHFMSAAADYAYTDMRPLEKAKWFECLEYKLIGVEIAKFLEAPKFPTDIVYNWKRKYIVMYDTVRAFKAILESYIQHSGMNWAQARMDLYEQGLDADLYIRLSQNIILATNKLIGAIEMTPVLDFVFNVMDPQYNEENNPSSTAMAWQTFNSVKKMFIDTKKVFHERDMSKQWWAAVDASYESHHHLKHWWASLDKVEQSTDTERVFQSLKHTLKSSWRRTAGITRLHNLRKKLTMPLNTGVQSCAERGFPGWCTECAVFDNIIQTTVEQGNEIAHFYTHDFKTVINDVEHYFNSMADYNGEFFQGIFGRLQSQRSSVIPTGSIRWTAYVANDWKTFFQDFGKYIQHADAEREFMKIVYTNTSEKRYANTNGTNRQIWLQQIDHLLDASRQFVKTTTDEYVPFYGYSFYHMYNYLLFNKCDTETTIYARKGPSQSERLENMDTALVVCAIVIALIITNTTWSIIPLVWLANILVISAIVTAIYLYIVYGYFLNCAPLIPYPLAEDINAWYHTRMQPGCFYKTLPFIAINATQDTCLQCATKQVYQNCAEYTVKGYEQGMGMLTLKELIHEYGIAWPLLFWVRWKWPSIAIFTVKNGIIKLESVVGRLAAGAWQGESVDPVWVDCYNAMWLDNVLMAGIIVAGAYTATKLTFIAIQTVIQFGILLMYIYTTLSYMLLAVEKSVIIR